MDKMSGSPPLFDSRWGAVGRKIRDGGETTIDRGALAAGVGETARSVREPRGPRGRACLAVGAAEAVREVEAVSDAVSGSRPKKAERSIECDEGKWLTAVK